MTTDTDALLATVREARAYIEEHGPPGTAIETTEESARRVSSPAKERS
jgi:hypothetical protein